MTTPDPLRDLWQSQPTEELDQKMLIDLQNKSAQMNKKTTQRNWRETIASAAVVPVFLFYAKQTHDPLLRAAWLLTAAGGALVILTLWRRGRMRPPPSPSEPSTAYLAYYRGELQRERDLLSSAWLWYIGPIIPGFSLAFFALTRWAPSAWTFATYAIVLATFGFIAWLNKRAAKKLGRELEALATSPG